MCFQLDHKPLEGRDFFVSPAVSCWAPIWLIYWLENKFYFLSYCHYPKGVTMNLRKNKTNSESWSPALQINKSSTQGSMEAKTVSKRDRTSLSWWRSSPGPEMMEGNQTCSQNDVKLKWIYLTHSPSIHSAEPALSDFHPFPHSMNWSFSAQRERCALWVPHPYSLKEDKVQADKGRKDNIIQIRNKSEA